MVIYALTDKTSNKFLVGWLYHYGYILHDYIMELVKLGVYTKVCSDHNSIEIQLSLANSCTDKAVWPCAMTWLIESNTTVIFRRCRGTEVGRANVTAPTVTFFIAVGIPRDMEAFIERCITYQQLIFVLCWGHTLRCPQAICMCPLIIITSKCNSRPIHCESSFLFRFHMDKQHTCKLKKNHIGNTLHSSYFTTRSQLHIESNKECFLHQHQFCSSLKPEEKLGGSNF